MAAAEGDRLRTLTLGALGVVFGDIGTSPLYALRQCLEAAPANALDAAAIHGILSLVIWALILIVCVKYLGFVLRADNEGEGGTLALLGLLRAKGPAWGPGKKPLGAVAVLALFAAALLYGDGMITPSISVLSAVEGLEIATYAMRPVVVPLALGILIGLFLLQYHGTGRVGAFFGPALILWFLVLAALGVGGILRHPAILEAFNPVDGVRFLSTHGWRGYEVLGAVVLCVTGTEAMFADLGHFGRRPIVLAWYCLVLPALLLNYLGQGALIAAEPGAADGPFYALVPHWAIYPVVLLSTVATVIASQAVISGAFSLTQQAINMGLLPRFAVIHTSHEERGQIYVPSLNIFLMVGCVGLVLLFRSSARLGSAYGLAVTGTMTITSVIFFLILRLVWNWRRLPALALVAGFLTVDLAFLGANVTKIGSGAWVPLAIAAFVFAVMAVWTDGRRLHERALAGWTLPVAQLEREMRDWPARSEGTAVFLTGNLDEVPLIGRHEWLRRHVRYEHVLLLDVQTWRLPYVPARLRLRIEECGGGLYRGTAAFGFMQNPDLPAVLCGADAEWSHGCEGMVFYLPEPVATDAGSWWHRLRGRAFVFLGRNALSPIEYFRIPPHQAVLVGLELGL